jgi:hypothetical protein
MICYRKNNIIFAWSNSGKKGRILSSNFNLELVEVSLCDPFALPVVAIISYCCCIETKEEPFR